MDSEFGAWSLEPNKKELFWGGQKKISEKKIWRRNNFLKVARSKITGAWSLESGACENRKPLNSYRENFVKII